MLKEFLKTLDIFLPAQFSESVELSLLYRGRVIVATNIVSLFVLLAQWAIFFLLNFSLLIHVGVFLCIITLVVHLYYLKTRLTNFDRDLLIGSSVQVLVLTALIYLTTFSAKGMGFFGLVWLFPIFLTIAFNFNTRYSFYFSLTNFALYFSVSYFHYDRFLEPVNYLPNFAKIFFIFLSLVIILAYALAFLFVHLNEELQGEILKQRDLLIESAKFQSLGQMASNLAHDINNPLFTIQGKLHQMRNLLSRDQLDLEKCDQIVESVEVTLLRLSQIVKGISTFAREGRGDQMVSISVTELIENNLALATDRIKKSGIELEIQIDSNAKIICYPSFLSQVLLNLLNNAIDALDGSDTKRIEVRSYLETNWIYITVSDTGVGVSPEIEKRIFDPFFTTKTLGKGTGLGLSISKGLVEVHEGQLTYERRDQKTIFLVRLPSYE